MAPEDWEDGSSFPHSPRQLNTVDTIAERHRFGGGLVEAFEACAEAAVRNGVWNASGQRRHSLETLTALIRDIYETTWVPRARAAYSAARAHLRTQLAEPRNANPQRQLVLKQRRDILDTQIAVFNSETTASPEAAKNVWKFTAGELWS
jgi:hypothetical protein